MDEKNRTSISKFLSYVLRHRPQAIGIVLESGGWTNVERLLDACCEHGRPLTGEELEAVVASNRKQRFALSHDGLKIRANQGHSVDVNLRFEPTEPPEVLYHGTVRRFLSAIQAHGLLRMERHHVHLSADEATALAVGARRGNPVVLRIDASAMRRAGYVFFCAPNGVWLTETVPSEFISGFNNP